jgi:hypothetical protein
VSATAKRSAEAFAFVLGASCLVDLAMDTPWRRGTWIGPFFQLTPATQRTSATCAALLALLTGFLLFGRFPASSEERDGDLREILLGLLPVVSMLYALLWARVFVGHSSALIPWNAMAVAAPLLACACALKRWPLRYLLAPALVVGLTVRLLMFARFPVDEGADMLPLTEAALRNFVKGANPYTYYNLPDPLPLTYYPLTWLAYLPLYVAHLDIRWTNLAAEMAILAAIVVAAGGWRDTPARRLGLVAWSFLFLLPSSVHFDRITTAPVAWALIAWTVVLLVRRSRHDWVLLGATAAATPLAAILVPFACVAWWKEHSPRGMLRRGLQAGLLASVILAPFVLWSPRGFLEGAVLWFNDLSRYPGVSWKAYQPWARYLGFAGLFWRHGLERALAPIQWLLVGGITVLFVKRGRQHLAAHVAAAFAAFMLFNSVNWPYFYQPAIFLGLIAVVTTDLPGVTS